MLSQQLFFNPQSELCNLKLRDRLTNKPEMIKFVSGAEEEA